MFEMNFADYASLASLAILLAMAGWDRIPINVVAISPKGERKLVRRVPRRQVTEQEVIGLVTRRVPKPRTDTSIFVRQGALPRWFWRKVEFPLNQEDFDVFIGEVK